MTRDEEADEEEVARGRDKDHGSDVVTRRLVSPSDSKRLAGFSRSAKTVKLARRDPGSGTRGNRSRTPTFVTDVRCVDAIRRRRDGDDIVAHLAETRISRLRNEKEKIED